MEKLTLPLDKKTFNQLPISNSFEEWNTIPKEHQQQFIDCLNSQQHKEFLNEINQENENEIQKLRKIYNS